MTEDEKPAEQPYVDDSPDEAPAPDVPQSPEETPKTDEVPAESIDKPLDSDGVAVEDAKE